MFDFDGWVYPFASYLRFSIRMAEQVLGSEPPSVMAMVAADKATHMTAALGQTFALPGGALHRVPATLPLARIVARLNDLQPDYLSGYASMVHLLTREAAAGRLRIAPRLVGTTSEPLLPDPDGGGRDVGRADLQRLRVDGRARWRLRAARGVAST